MTTTTNEHEAFEVPLYCLYRGCEKRGRLALHNPSSGGYGYTARDGWLAYAPGFPSQRSLGFCPEHQRFTVASGGGPALDVVVTSEQHGVYYEVSKAGVTLGKTTVPINTLVMQPAPGEASAALKAAIPPIEAMLDFDKRKPERTPRQATRDELLAALTGRHQLTPIEVTADNVEVVRREFSLGELGAGNIVWRIPNSNQFGVAHSRVGQAPPLRATMYHLVPQRERAVYVGEVIIVGRLADQDDTPWLQLGANSGLVHLLTGQFLGPQ